MGQLFQSLQSSRVGRTNTQKMIINSRSQVVKQVVAIGYSIGNTGGREAGLLFEITRTYFMVTMVFKLGFEAALSISSIFT